MRLRVLAIMGLALALSAPVLAKGLSPRLRMTATAPATVRGAAFRPRERVRVVLTATGFEKVQRARASARGTFTIVFAGVSLDVCTSWRLVATGGAGSRAELRPRPQACPPPPPTG